jgi:hypothetical protein
MRFVGGKTTHFDQKRHAKNEFSSFLPTIHQIKIVEHLCIRKVIIHQTGKCYLHHFQGIFFKNFNLKKKN